MNIHLETHQDETAYGLRVLTPVMIQSTPSAVEVLGETYLDRRNINVTILNAVDGEAVDVEGHVVQLFHLMMENGHVTEVRAHEIATELTATGVQSGERFTLRPVGFDHRASGVGRSCAVVTMTYRIEKYATNMGLVHEDIQLFLDDNGDLRSLVENYTSD